MSVLRAFFDHPAGIRFKDQEADEVIELFLRQHPIVNIPWLLTVIFLILIPFIIIRLNTIMPVITFQIPPDAQFYLWTVWGGLVLAYIIEKSLYWYFNTYIVTNKHIIDLDFSSLLHSRTTEIEIRDVESTAATYKGIFGPFFNYGDVIIETAAKDQQAGFIAVPYPYKVADTISDFSQVEGGGDNAP